jgi:hypothetical protein
MLISGHSLGAGQSKLLAYFIAKKWPDVIKHMRVVNWAGPASFNTDGARDYNDIGLGENTWEINNFEDFVPGFANVQKFEDRIYRNAPPVRKIVQTGAPYLARAQTTFRLFSGPSNKFMKKSNIVSGNQSTQNSGKTSNPASTSLTSGLSSSMSKHKIFDRDDVKEHDL